MQQITRGSRELREEIPMARMIRHERNAPYEVPEGTELPLYICACGLSKNKPFCDGSHKITRDENPSDVYVYDGNGKDRVRVINQY
jgi:CDGSH iron-sulfur domain-containing protein 3